MPASGGARVLSDAVTIDRRSGAVIARSMVIEGRDFRAGVIERVAMAMHTCMHEPYRTALQEDRLSPGSRP